MEFSSITLCFVLFLFVQSVSSQNPTTKENAIYPPKGWNSYTSFSWTIGEQEFLENADQLSSILLDHGYEVATVDAFWYRSLGDEIDTIDQWGRPFPDPKRWPSSVNGVGFQEVANQVHRKGLKFGIHVVGGISLKAIDQNTPILNTSSGAAYKEGGREWTAKDIFSTQCPFAPSFMYVNTSLEAGKAFLRSMFELYASWGVDFVKLDCVFGENFNLNTITTVSEILKEFDDAIILSVSPGVKATVDMAKQVSGLVNMYRVSPNNWDNWPNVRDHFDIARDFAAAGLIGVDGLRGNSWPDLDMLPFGRLTDPDVRQGPHRYTNLRPEEQRTQITLWTMARSPVMYGGDLRDLDLQTRMILINPTIQEIHFYSSNNREFDLQRDGFRAWIATGRKGEVYVAIFNLQDKTTTIQVPTSFLGTILPEKKFTVCQSIEVWNQVDDYPNYQIAAVLGAHDCALYVMNCT